MMRFLPALRPTITSKVALLLLLFTCGALVGVWAFNRFLVHTDNVGHSINVAGRQRMLSEQLHIYAEHVRTEQQEIDRESLRNAAATFENSLESLEQGGEVMGRTVLHAPPGAPDEIAQVRRVWQDIKPALLLVAELPVEDPQAQTAYRHIRSNIQVLADASDRVVTALEAHDQEHRQQMRRTLLVIAGLDLALLLAGLWAIRRQIARPIRFLTDAARRVRAGDFAHPVPIVTRDELATLGHVFNEMSAAVAGLLASADAERAASGASAEHFRGLLQGLDAIVWEADAATFQFSFVSRRAQDILGYPVERWLREVDFLMNRIEPEDRDRVIVVRQRVRSAGPHGDVEYRVRAADGRVVWLRDHMHVVRDADGRTRQLRGVMVDITSRKQAEDALRNLAEGVSPVTGAAFFRTLVQRLAKTLEPDYVFVGGLAGKNWDTIKTIAVCAAGEIVENFEYPLRDTPCETVVGKVLCSYPQGVQQQFPRDHLLAEMGVESYVGAPLFDSAGRPSGLLVVMARKALGNTEFVERVLRIFATRAAAELERMRAEEEHARLSLVVEQASESIAVTKRDGTIVYVNAAFERVTGYPAAEALGQTMRLIKSGKQSQAYYEHMWQTILAGQVWHAEVVNRRKNGELFVEEQSIAPLRDERGEITYFVSVGQDITQRKRAEERTQALLAELERANQLKSNFLATMSHELRTPLNIIMGYNGLLLEQDFGPVTAEQVEALRTVDKSARELLELIDGILDLTQLDAGQAPVDLKETDLPELISEIDAETRQLREKPNLSFVWDVAAQLPRLHTDPLKLKAVLKKLIANAAKFTDKGSVTVSIAGRDDGVEISVADTGTGIAPEVLPIISEPFRQADGSMTRQYGGVGLGLHIARRLLELLGGTITVDSEVGRGSTFRVWVPPSMPPSRRAA